MKVEFPTAVVSTAVVSTTGVFVTGTGTGVGKTVIAACLVRAWSASYWNPVQTGLADEEGDSATVVSLARLPPDRLIPPRHVFKASLAPHDAASLEHTAISLADFVLPATANTPMVVEGAGGVLVPLTNDTLVVDLMLRLGLPALVVAGTGLGTINHTLLTLEAIRSRGVPLVGVILNGPPNAGNRAAIERYGRVRIIAEVPPLNPLNPAAVTRIAAEQIPSLASLIRP